MNSTGQSIISKAPASFIIVIIMYFDNIFWNLIYFFFNNWMPYNSFLWCNSNSLAVESKCKHKIIVTLIYLSFSNRWAARVLVNSNEACSHGRKVWFVSFYALQFHLHTLLYNIVLFARIIVFFLTPILLSLFLYIVQEIGLPSHVATFTRASTYWLILSFKGSILHTMFFTIYLFPSNYIMTR